MHVAHIDYAAFYRSAFGSAEDATAFIACVEATPATVSRSKIVMHQGARLLWLSDRIAEAAVGRPALQILFHVIAAEAVAKICANFQGEGQSRRHVQQFYEELCGPTQRETLESAFSWPPPGRRLTLREAVDLLYDVRCDVAHEGQYYDFHMPNSGGGMNMLTPYKGDFVLAHVPIERLRQVVLEGALLAALSLLSPESPCRGAARFSFGTRTSSCYKTT